MDVLILNKLKEVCQKIPFNDTLGMQVRDITADSAVIEFDVQPHLIGNFHHQILHGGVISAVLDMVGGAAAMCAAIHKNSPPTLEDAITIISKTSTINLQISFIKPGRGNHFKALAHVTHAGNKICFTQMSLKNEQEKLIATGEGTYLVS